MATRFGFQDISRRFPTADTAHKTTLNPGPRLRLLSKAYHPMLSRLAPIVQKPTPSFFLRKSTKIGCQPSFGEAGEHIHPCNYWFCVFHFLLMVIKIDHQRNIVPTHVHWSGPTPTPTQYEGEGFLCSRNRLKLFVLGPVFFWEGTEHRHTKFSEISCLFQLRGSDFVV